MGGPEPGLACASILPPPGLTDMGSCAGNEDTRDEGTIEAAGGDRAAIGVGPYGRSEILHELSGKAAWLRASILPPPRLTDKVPHASSGILRARQRGTAVKGNLVCFFEGKAYFVEGSLLKDKSSH